MEHASDLVHRSLGQLVSENGRAAAVLDRFGLDYCCRGRQTLEEAATARGVALPQIVEALVALDRPSAEERGIESADLDVLIRHIVDRHHRYVQEVSPTINAWLDKLAARHGNRHPELRDVQQVFRELSDELLSHMRKEEHILFPFITELAVAIRWGVHPPQGPFGTIQNPVRMMESEHVLVRDLLARLRAATRDFTPPENGCTTYRLCYAELATFEQDLHRHVHLENNVLFPKAMAMENDLS